MINIFGVPQETENNLCSVDSGTGFKMKSKHLPALANRAGHEPSQSSTIIEKATSVQIRGMAGDF